MKSTRQLVYDTLMRVFYKNAYSNISLDAAIQGSGLDKIQISFTSALFYGVLERSIELDYSISRYLKKGIDHIDKELLVILRMGFYQICYLDSVPDMAAVDESVRLASYARKTSAKGFVNAVLRSFLRDGSRLCYPDKEKDMLFYYSIRYSCPRWILEQISSQYGIQKAINFAKASLQRPPLFARVNTLKTTSDKLIESLEARGVRAKKHELLENCLLLNETGSIEKLSQYRKGFFHVQDASSQLCVKALAPKPGETVLDICAAPGSKSFTAAQYMNNEGLLYSFDLYKHKVKLINDGANRLGIFIIHTDVRDGTSSQNKIISADKILCDVPCSGLGVIRRKPEIKYKPSADIAGLPEIQLRILSNAASCVKMGGILIYSTCTLNKSENEEVVLKFLSQNNSFKPLQLTGIFSKIKTINDSMVTLFPSIDGGDGFFISAMKRQ